MLRRAGHQHLARPPAPLIAIDQGEELFAAEDAQESDRFLNVLAALLKGRSLLPAGVVRTTGRFDRGDTVSVLAPDGREIARGITAYSDQDALRILGRHSADIESILGFRSRDEMIHRDDLVLLDAVDNS